MEIQIWVGFLLTLTSASFFVQVKTDNAWMIAGQSKRCSYHRAYHMLGAYCSGLNLHVLPTTLKPSIEVLDASFNRIRDLRNTTFQLYTSLRFLYLGDNMIQNIEPLAFEPLTSLEVLDLSLNALITIPASVLNIGSLRKLYMSDNALTTLHADLEKYEKPIRAPLTFLSIADCHLTAMPDFGVMAELEHLNASGNHFSELHPRNFASMCSLKNVDLNGSYELRDQCEAQMLISWFEEHAVQVIYTSDSLTTGTFVASGCLDNGYDEETKNFHTECKSTVKTKQLSRTVKNTWIIIAGSLGGFLLTFMVLLYLLHRRNVNQMKETNKKLAVAKLKEQNSSKTATALLSDVS